MFQLWVGPAQENSDGQAGKTLNGEKELCHRKQSNESENICFIYFITVDTVYQKELYISVVMKNYECIIIHYDFLHNALCVLNRRCYHNNWVNLGV